MKYLIFVIDETTGSATPAEMTDIDAFNQRLVSDGHWILAGGLASPGAATLIDGRGERPVFMDGPFIESKEYYAGFWVIDAPDPEAARELAAAGSKSCNRKVELRPFLGE